MRCPACTRKNADGATRCVACNASLPAPAADLRNAFAAPAAGGASSEVTLTQEEAWAAMIGPSNTHGYLAHFRRLALGGSAGWHWPAFCTTWFWMLYRKMWLSALVYPFTPIVTLFAVVWLCRPFLLLAMLAWFLAVLLLPAVIAHRWYFSHCTRRIRDIRATGGSRDQMLEAMASAGGTSVAAAGVGAGLVGALLVGVVVAVGIPAWKNESARPHVAAALNSGYTIAESVGATAEKTHAMPSNADVHRLFAERTMADSLHGVDIDPATGVLTLDVVAAPGVAGKILLTPEAENGHYYWNCSTDDLQAYVPYSCRRRAADRR